jgi:hypothetical protein
MLSSASQLLGKKLDGGWIVIESLKRDPKSTGGHFSKCYLVEDTNGQKAFLKALDYSIAF